VVVTFDNSRFCRECGLTVTAFRMEPRIVLLDDTRWGAPFTMIKDQRFTGSTASAIQPVIAAQAARLQAGRVNGKNFRTLSANSSPIKFVRSGPLRALFALVLRLTRATEGTNFVGILNASP
jgi:hypothetical protein